MELTTVKKQFGDHELIIETGKMAKQADGSVVLKYAGNVMLVTACMSDEPLENPSFFPLTVNYNEKYYAAGKIPGGYLKRESKPSDEATLIARMIDRPIRPLFPKNFFNEIQIVPTTLSADMEYSVMGVLGIVGASAALSISRIPVIEAIGGVRVIYLDGIYKANPKLSEIEKSSLDIMVAGTREGITMVEGGAREVPEEVLIGALEYAHKFIIESIELIEELTSIIKPEKYVVEEATPLLDEETARKIREYAFPLIKQHNLDADKKRRSNNIKEAGKQALENCGIDKENEAYGEAKQLLEDLETEIVRSQIIDEGVRADGRDHKTIRDITIDLDLYENLHGSALFTRGQTQSLGIVTLGTVKDVKYIDGIETKETETSNFMLHYNFPSFSVGEVRRMGPPGRREIGHGYLAKRAIDGLLPSEDDFPYTIRMVSEVLESNGSSSMASVCSASLAMMAAGVPITAHVAGIAMGMVWDKEKGKYVVLSDIQGLEDHLGDMDFKVAGTEKGITAFQMDVKTMGITREIMETALNQAREGRLHILSIMDKAISKARPEVAPSAPKIKLINVPEDGIGLVIGAGGKVIRRIMATTGVDISIEDDGRTLVSSTNVEMLDKAIDIIRHIVYGFDKNEEIDGVVTRIEDYGAFVELVPGATGLLHRSRMKERIPVKDKYKIGDVVRVRYEGMDDKKRIVISEV
jgi:polyribonucleotide nucleotidyltransferase